jgi:HAD superfamily hydrolase (TIGR01450 family)
MTSGNTAGLIGSAEALAERYDVALLDLDGVVYLGAQAVPGAVDALSAARQRGMRLTFVTNNAARTAEMIADHLRSLGLPARAGDVVTSSHAAAHYLADRMTTGTKVLVLGGAGLVDAIRERGLTAVGTADDDVAAVAQGYSPELNWRMLAEGAIAIRRGVPWVATNLDPTLPSPRGPLPGNGSLVAALRTATGASPVSTGKPDPAMHRETVERSSARQPLVVGDRLDTDIQGANAVGCHSLLVLTGVTDPALLLKARPEHRPSYVSFDLAGLLEPHPRPTIDAAGTMASCRGWRARLDDGGTVLLSGDRTPEPTSSIDALRALCMLTWASGEPRTYRAEDPPSRAALAELHLA